MSCNSCGGKPKKPDCNSCKPRGPPKKIVNDCGPRNDCQEEEEVVPSFCISFPKGRMPVIKTICPPKDEEQSCSPEQPPACPTESDDDEEDCDDSEDSTNCEQSDNAPKTCDQAPPVIVVDMGSGFTKAGFAGELCPRIEMATVIGRPRAYLQVPASEFAIPRIGNDALSAIKTLNFTRPVEGGVVNNWCDTEAIYNNVFCKLQADVCGGSVLVTEPPLNPDENREKLTQIMFEKFRVGQLYVGHQAVMSLYFHGISTGVVADIGYDLMQTVPIFEGHAMPHASLRQELAGRHLTEYMMRLLSEGGMKFESYEDFNEINGIKEKYCRVAVDFCKELKNANCTEKKCVTLCDGRKLQIGDEAFRCPEAMFRPDFLGLNLRPLHESVYTSVVLCDDQIQKCLLSNVVVSGGSSLFPGIAKRLKKDLECLVNCPQMTIKTIAKKKRENAVWTGASLLGSIATYQEMTIKSCEYDEVGPRIVHRKCF